MDILFKISKAIAFVGLVLISTTAWAGQQVFIYETAGTVSVANDNDTPRPAARNTPVTAGMVIRTGVNSHAVLKFEDGQVISLQANSTFKVREYNYDPNDAKNNKILFSLYKGVMHSITGLISKNTPHAFRLATPNATVRIRGAEFLVALNKGGTYYKALSEWVSVTNAAGESILTSGTYALIYSSFTLPILITPDKVPAGTFNQLAAISVPPTTLKQASPPSPETVALPDNIIVADDTTTVSGESSKDSVDVSSAATMKNTMHAEREKSGPMVASKTTSPAKASSPDVTDSTSMPFAHGIYAGIQLGYASYRYSNISNLGQIAPSLLGGYAINNIYSIEAKYSSLGGFESANGMLKGSSLDICSIANYPVNQQFNIFAKLGVARTQLKETPKPGFVGNQQHTNSGVMVGLGGQYKLNSTAGIRVGLDFNTVGDVSSGKSTAILLYTGGIFKF